MQQRLDLVFTVPVAGLLTESQFTVPTQEPNAGSYQLPSPTGGVAPYSWGITPGQTPPTGWAISASGLLSWTAAAGAAAAGTTVTVNWVSVYDSGS